MSDLEIVFGRLHDPRLIGELHHLLWVDSFQNRGGFDHGWMCRDHALVISQFLQLHGVPARIRHGKCMFVQGPSADGQPPVGNGQDVSDPEGHTWVFAEGLGDVDLSPKLRERLGSWRPLESVGVVGSCLSAPGPARFQLVNNLRDYERAIAQATHRPDEMTAIYYLAAEEPLTQAIVSQGLRWPNSRASLRLRKRHVPDDAYARLARHLFGLVSGERRPLSRVFANKVWSLLAADPALA